MNHNFSKEIYITVGNYLKETLEYVNKIMNKLLTLFKPRVTNLIIWFITSRRKVITF